jgi:tetratricopeptide (TPR) repeat protein
VPDEADARPALDSDAARLFLQSARRIRPAFEVEADDLPHLIEICRLVEGMPLGLELAAGWVDLLSLAYIVAEIRRNLDFLTTDHHNMPDRHRSMRAVFDTTWQQLSQTEQQIFVQLSIFRGGFTRDAAPTVVGASLQSLASLVSKSLLHYNPGRDRYETPELLRQFAAGRLAGSSADQAAALQRHSNYYLTLLQQREADFKGADQQAALTEISTEIENIRAAWDWAVFHKQSNNLPSAVDSLGLFCDWSGRYQDGERLFAAATDKLAPPEEQWSITPEHVLRLVSKLLTWQGVFEHRLGNQSKADQRLARSLAILDAPALADQAIESEKAFLLWKMETLSTLDTIGLEQAKRLCEQSLDLYQTVENRWGAANALDRLGWVLIRLNDHGAAKVRLEQSLSLYRALGDRWGLSLVLSKLTLAYIALGDLDAGKRLSLESLEIGRNQGYRYHVAFSMASAGYAYKSMGKYAEAIPILQEAMAIFQDIGFRLEVAYQNHHLGFIEAHLGHYEQAQQYAETSMALFQKLGQNMLVGSGQSYNIMGMVTLASGDYHAAQRHFQEAAGALKEGNKHLLAEALIGLAYATRALGEHHQARRHFLKALHTTLESQHHLLLTIILAPAALLLTDQDQPERAVELYSRALQHPHIANSRWYEAVVGRYIRAAAKSLLPEVVAAAEARGRGRDLWATAAALLKELETAG